MHIDYQPNSFNGGPSYDAKKADKEIKYCKKCKQCWQKDMETSNESHNRARNRIKYRHYNDFPSLGKKRELCNKCR